LIILIILGEPDTTTVASNKPGESTPCGEVTEDTHLDAVHEEAAETQGNKPENPLTVWCYLKEINIRKFVCQPEKGGPQ
jgi:hypothetical protein